MGSQLERESFQESEKSITSIIQLTLRYMDREGILEKNTQAPCKYQFSCLAKVPDFLNTLFIDYFDWV
jgi:hypothetical protein